MNSSRAHRRFSWAAGALTLIALLVRLQQISYHSLWFDEAMSVYWARSSLARIMEVSMNLVEDRLPPLYYLMLHGWIRLAGDGELGLRLLSALLGVLLVPVVYRLSLTLFDRRVALLAAALTALNPFLVWYGQEARMYALAVLLATLGCWFFLLAVQAAREGRTGILVWLAYGLCALAGLYTHLYTGFLLPAQALYLLLTFRRSRRAWLPFALTMLGVALLFSPLALATLRVSGEAGAGQPWQGVGDRLWALLDAFTIWKTALPGWLSTSIKVVTTGLLLCGLFLPVPGGRAAGEDTNRIPAPGLLLGLLLFTPLLIASLMLFRNQLAFFGQRYFIVIVPYLLILVAVGTVRLAAWVRTGSRAPTPSQVSSTSPASGSTTPDFSGQANQSSPLSPTFNPRRLLVGLIYLLPLVLTLLALPGQWSPSARKEAWRETVNYLADHAQAQDAILIHPDWTRFPLQYYFQGPGQTYAVFSSVGENTDLEGPLTVISRHPVLWLVESHTELADPDHQANAWLAARYPEVTELYPPGLAGIHAYAPGYISQALPDGAQQLELEFQDGLRLLGYELPDSRLPASDQLFHPPSNWVHVTLYWTLGESEATGSTVEHNPFVHLVDDVGQVWGASLDRPNDAFDFFPPDRWQPGQVIRADFDVNLNPITPPGSYSLVVGLQDGRGEQILLVDGSPQAALDEVEITP